MNRRRFLQHGARTLAAAPFFPIVARAAEAGFGAAQSLPPAVLNRIGITTVCFRERFPATRTKGATAPAGGDLTLLTAPKMIADELGIHNVEIWSAQFAQTTLDYCKQVKAAAAAAGSKIIDVQVDGPENLSDPDAAKRTASITAIKQWMDRAAAVGAPRMRANTGGGKPEEWDVNRTADSFRQLADYGKTIGVKILIENHIGYSADIDKVVQLAKAVNHPNCGVISDWGNTPSTSPADRVAGLSKLFPLSRARVREGARLRRLQQARQLRHRAAHQGDGGIRIQRDLFDRVLQRPSAQGRRRRRAGHDAGDRGEPLEIVTNRRVDDTS